MTSRGVPWRWSVAAIGTVLSAVTVAFFPLDGSSVAPLIPLGFSVAVAVFGVWLVRAGHDEAGMRRIAGWCFGGLILMTAVGTIVIVAESIQVVATAEVVYVVLSEATVGAAAGAAVGRYDVLRSAGEHEAALQSRRLRTIVDNAPVVLFAIDDAGRFLLSEGRGLESIGLRPGEVVGDQFEAVFEGAPDVVDLCRRALDGEQVSDTVTFGDRWFEAWFEPMTDTDESTGAIGVAVDVTAREQRERTFADLHGATHDLVRADTPAEATDIAVETGATILDQPFTIVWLFDPRKGVLRASNMSQNTDEVMPESGEPPSHGPGDPIWDAFERGELTVVDEIDPDTLAVDVPIQSVLLAPMGAHGLLTFGATEPNGFDGADVDLASILATNLELTLDRLESKEQLATLHEASRELLYAETAADIAELTVDIAQHIIDKPISTVWLYDDDRNELCATAATDSTRSILEAAGYDELPPIREGRLGMEVFREGELTAIARADRGPRVARAGRDSHGGDQ